jgi:hypothetical protein
MDMGAVAVGAYIRFLASAQGIRLTDVVKAADVQLKYMSALSRGEIKQPGTGTLRRMTERVNGSWEDIGTLMVATNATKEHGRQRAIAWAVESKLLDPRDPKIADITDDELEEALTTVVARRRKR